MDYEEKTVGSGEEDVTAYLQEIRQYPRLSVQEEYQVNRTEYFLFRSHRRYNRLCF